MFDCVMINNELDLLELRMEMLYDVVEKFVIVESNKSHTGNPKPLYVTENKDRFKKFSDKMLILVHSAQNVINNDSGMSWSNENTQRDLCLKSLEYSEPADGIFCVCDVDEIPNPVVLQDAKKLCKMLQFPVALNMYPCMYYMNYVSDIHMHRGPYLYIPSKAKETHERFRQPVYSPTMFRWHMCTPGYEKDFPEMLNAGWHFSTLGNVEKIRHKIESIAHTEYNSEKYKNDEYLRNCIENGLVFTGSDFKLMKKEISFLPEYVQKNLEKYKEYIL